jgi:hypothetical protein
MTTRAQQTKRRNSKIYTELQLMYTRLTGEAPPARSEGYQRLMKQVRRYVAPIMIEQENQKKGKGNVKSKSKHNEQVQGRV